MEVEHLGDDAIMAHLGLGQGDVDCGGYEDSGAIDNIDDVGGLLGGVSQKPNAVPTVAWFPILVGLKPYALSLKP
eukprot:2626634-Pyramimonas_sp.AAC.1